MNETLPFLLHTFIISCHACSLQQLIREGQVQYFISPPFSKISLSGVFGWTFASVHSSLSGWNVIVQAKTQRTCLPSSTKAQASFLQKHVVLNEPTKILRACTLLVKRHTRYHLWATYCVVPYIVNRSQSIVPLVGGHSKLWSSRMWGRTESHSSLWVNSEVMHKISIPLFCDWSPNCWRYHRGVKMNHGW